MILSDREIRAALDRGAVVIDPLPTAKAWSLTAVDLMLDHQLRKWISPSDENVEAAVCPANPRYNFTALVTRHTPTVDLTSAPYDLKPDDFILGWTIERIRLPHRSRLAARVEGKSSLARLGMGIHVTAPTIHAGFGFDPNSPQDKGNPIQLEIWNIGALTIRLVAGMPICQLIFEEVHGTPDKGYQGQFTHQGGGKWSAAEDTALLGDYDQGVPVDQLAERLQRGVRAVEVRLPKLGRVAPGIAREIHGRSSKERE